MQTSEKNTYELPSLENSMGEVLGIEFMTVEEGLVKAKMPVDHRTCQPFGILNVDITSPEGKLISTARIVNQIVKRR